MGSDHRLAGGFVASVEMRRRESEPGRAIVWVRTGVPLIDDEVTTELARAFTLIDVVNAVSVREDPRRVAFSSLDLTAHLTRGPVGEWLGFDTQLASAPRTPGERAVSCTT